MTSPGSYPSIVQNNPISESLYYRLIIYITPNSCFAQIYPCLRLKMAENQHDILYYRLIIYIAQVDIKVYKYIHHEFFHGGNLSTC